MNKTLYNSLVTPANNFQKKYDELSESIAFDQKLIYFTDQNGLKWGPHEN